MKKSSHSNLNSNTNLTGASRSRLYSTTTRRNAELVEASSSSEMALSPRLEYSHWGLGHKFGLPDMPLPRTEHFKRRYDPVVEQLTKGLMRHGKLSVAQKVCFLLIMLLLDISRLPLLSFFSEHVCHTRYTADCTS